MIRKRKENHPYWLAFVKDEKFAPVTRDEDADVLVVGAGITGLTAAYLLAMEGKKVAVADALDFGCGDTGHTSAHLTCLLGYSYSDIIKKHGRDKARLVLESHLSAVDFIERFIHEWNIDCHFSRLNAYLYPADGKDIRYLEEEKEALKQLGYHDAVLLKTPPGNSWFEGPSLVFPRQARFHIYRYLKALADAVISWQGKIFTQTRITSIGRRGAVTENGYRIRAEHIIVATHAPVKAPFFFLKEAAYRTYVVAAGIRKFEGRAFLGHR